MKSSWSFRDSSDFTKQVIVGLISFVILNQSQGEMRRRMG